MQLVGKIVSAILALLAIPMFTIAACNLAIEAAVFNRDTYDAVLEDDVIFDEMLAVALPLALSVGDADINVEEQNNTPVRFADIIRALEGKPETWTEITNLIIPADWLQITTTQLADVIFGLIDGDLDVIENEIDMAELRDRLGGEAATEAATLIIREAPACNGEQIRHMQSVVSGDEDFLPICRPANEAMENRAIETISNWFNFMALEFEGDVTSVAQMFDISRDDARAFSIIMEIAFNQVLMLFYLCPAAFLSLIIIFTVRSIGQFGRWIGGITLTVGILILMAILALQVFTFGAINDATTNSSTPAEQFLARFGTAMLRSTVSESSSSLLLQSGLFIGIGFLFFALAWYFGRNRDEEGSVVLITEDGQVISTATQRRPGTLEENIDDDPTIPQVPI